MAEKKKYVNKIGIEREYWLVDKEGIIIEPALYGFPFDEFGFLVEIRGNPCTNAEALLSDFGTKFKELHKKAESLGLKLEIIHRRPVNGLFINRLSKKYHYDTLTDLTANIHVGTNKSHATGLDSGYGTAGLHIHFSRHNNDEYGNRVQLPIFEIVDKMDNKFRSTILAAKRTLGEFEIKTHGFEYRSLPTDSNLQTVVEYAFLLLGLY